MVLFSLFLNNFFILITLVGLRINILISLHLVLQDITISSVHKYFRGLLDIVVFVMTEKHEL